MSWRRDKLKFIGHSQPKLTHYRHRSSARNLFVVISGEWEIEVSDGTKRSFSATDVLLVDDTYGKGHNSRVVSKEDSLALLVELKSDE